MNPLALEYTRLITNMHALVAIAFVLGFNAVVIYDYIFGDHASPPSWHKFGRQILIIAWLVYAAIGIGVFAL